MRKLVINGWNLLLLVILMAGFLVSLSAALGSVPALATPGLVPVCLLIVVEALVTQRLAVAARLGWADQWRLRALEWAILLVVIRVWALLTEGRSLLEQVTPWLRDPLAFWTQFYAVRVVLAAAIWLIATGLGHRVLLWSAELLPVAQLDRMTIERSHVDAEQFEAVRRFDGQLTTIVLITVLLALFAIRGASPQQQLQPALVRPAAAAFGTVLIALLLHSAAHLRQITDGWRLDGAQVEAGVIRSWQRMGVLVLALALLLGPLLGPLALLTPPLPLVPLINALLLVATLLGTVLLFLLALLITPFAWLLSLLQGKPDFRPPVAPHIDPPQLPVDHPITARPLLPGIIFWSCLLLLLVVALVRYVRQHDDILRWIGRSRIGRWLLAHCRILWRDATEWVEFVAQAVRRRLRRRPPVAHRPPRPSGTQGHLRALYHELIRAGEAQGVAHAPSATPFEYSSALGAAVPPVEPDIAALTDLYVRAEYGPLLPDDEDIRRGRQRWRRIQQWLGGTRQAVGAVVQKRRLRVRSKPEQ